MAVPTSSSASSIQNVHHHPVVQMPAGSSTWPSNQLFQSQATSSNPSYPSDSIQPPHLAPRVPNNVNTPSFRFSGPSQNRRPSNKRGRSSTSSVSTPVHQASPGSESAVFNRFYPPHSEQPRHSVRDLIQYYPGGSNARPEK